MNVLRARGISKRFSGIVALDAVDIDVDEGERVGLIGPNGAGKTTFFNCVLGVVRADGGTVELHGEDIGRLPVHERARRGIGRTFQRLELFPEITVRDHLLVADRVHRRTGRFLEDLVGLGRPRRDEIARCDDVLDLLGLGHLAEEPVERLSLGQGRLVEVGRALMTQPQLLLLDEPSSGLSVEETEEMAFWIQDIRTLLGITVLMVEHDMSLVSAVSDRVLALNYGRPLALGTAREVQDHPDVVKAYLGG